MGVHREKTVYVARGLESGLYKIGSTNNVRLRMFSLRSASHEGIELLAAIDGTLAMEHALHRRFSALVAPGRGREWFRDDGSIAAFVAALPSASRASMTLPTLSVSRRPRRSHDEVVAARSEADAKTSAWFQKRHGHPAPMRPTRCPDCARMRAALERTAALRLSRRAPFVAGSLAAASQVAA